MANLYKYRVWCITESSWVNTWGTEEPTTCPNNESHTIDSDKIVVTQKKEDVGPVDRSGKTRVHQTSRKLGTKIGWTGEGDDPSDVHNIGGGEPFIIDHTIGDGPTSNIYIDFNIVNNETWLHEGYMTWKSCHLDKLSLMMVPRVTEAHVDSTASTNYSLYGGYMIVPAAGDGTLVIDSDITDPNAGLIYMPDNDLGEAPTAFWNADYNSSTKLYEHSS